MMTDFVMFITFLGSLSMLLWVIWPLISRQRALSVNALDEMSRQRTEILLQSLRDLGKEREQGDVNEADYENMERRVMLELARIYEDRGIDPATALQPAESSDMCPSCGGPIKADYKHCPACGHVLAA